MGISADNHSSFNINSGIRLAGVKHTDFSGRKSAPVKHNSTNISSNNGSAKNEALTGGLVRNKAASVDLSTEGQSLAKKLRDDKINDLKDKTAETRSSLDRVDELNAKLRNGEEFTDDDRDFINNELKNLSSRNYAEKRFHVMTKDDYEGVMAALQENMIQRIRLYSDMQKELEAQKDSDKANKTAQMVAEAEQDNNQQKRIIEILNETLSDDEDEENESAKESASASDEDTASEENGVIEFENEEHAAKSSEDLLKFRAIGLIDQNKEQLDSMFAQSAGETEEIRDINDKMDAELIRSYDLLAGNDLTEEEKLSEFNRSSDYMLHLFSDKAIETAKSKMDFDTWLVGKIDFANHNNIREVIKDDDVIKAMGGIDMVRDFLINANAF